MPNNIRRIFLIRSMSKIYSESFASAYEMQDRIPWQGFKYFLDHFLNIPVLTKYSWVANNFTPCQVHPGKGWH